MSGPTSSHQQQSRSRGSNAESPTSSSTSCRLPPLRAVLPYQLLLGGQSSPSPLHGPASGLGSSPPSPTLNLSGNGLGETKPTSKQRLSPDNRGCCSPDRGPNSPDQGPNSPVCRAERSRLQVRSSSSLWRTWSLDAITGQYLRGQWPRDAHAHYPSCMKDKATQTPGFWVEEGEDVGCPHQRSFSWGSADHLKEIAKLRQQLQRSKQVSRQGSTQQQGQVTTTSQPQPKPAPQGNTSLPKALTPRGPSSVEGINHELENVFITKNWEQGIQAMDALDGRRAPFPSHQYGNSSENTCNSDPQAPPSGESSPRPQPSAPDPLHSPSGSPSSAEELHRDNGCTSPLAQFATSPKPNNSYLFQREPPEGCERIRVFDEMLTSYRSEGFPLFSCPDRNKVNFIPKGSAFCPVKLLSSSPTLDFYAPLGTLPPPSNSTDSPDSGPHSDTDIATSKHTVKGHGGSTHSLLTS